MKIKLEQKHTHPPHPCKYCGGTGQTPLKVKDRWMRYQRLEKRMKLREVAEATGFSPQYICDVEHGRRKCPVRVRLYFQGEMPNSP